MSHHHHHHHAPDVKEMGSIYISSMVLNLLFVIVEAVVGFVGDSLGLLSDAGHNLGDVFSLLLAFVGLKLAATHGSKRFTYGYKKSSVLIALINAIILLVAVGAIVVESIHKLGHPAEVDGSLVAITAGVGIIINGLTAWLLSRQAHHDINTRGAYLHMMADTLVSAGVLVSGLVISHTGWTIIDPIISLIIAMVILTSTWSLLSESLRLSIDAVPEHIDLDAVKQAIAETPGISDVHHVHVWPLSTTEIALTAHVKTDTPVSLHEVKKKLVVLGISHTTIEIETEPCHCEADCGY